MQKKQINKEVNMLSNVEVRSVVARVEDLTTAQFDLLIEDDKFKNMFHLLIKGNNVDLKSISKRLADYANENIC
jgi:thioester reductase-like protein